MANSSRSRKTKKKKWYENQALLLAILGVVTALITVSPQLIEAFQKLKPTPTVIPPTATAIIVESPTSTLEPVTPTDTPVPLPTDTATLSPTPTPITPPISCLNQWEIVSSNPDLAATSGQGDCNQASVPALGISSSNAGISFGINSLKEQGTFGIATSLPSEATVNLQVNLSLLTQGEFWIALSNTPNPENKMFILGIQPNTGEVRLYINQTSKFSNKYNYKDLLTNTILTSSPPYNYNITFVIRGNSVKPTIHFTDLPSQIVNLPKYLFIGYTKQSALGSMSLQAEITNLTVDIK